MGHTEINDSQFIFCPMESDTAVGGILVGIKTYRQLTIYCYSLIDRSISSTFYKSQIKPNMEFLSRTWSEADQSSLSCISRDQKRICVLVGE